MSLEGRLEDLGLPDLFQIIGMSKRSGILTLIHRSGSGRLVFHEGNVVYASSDKKSRFGYTLMRKGIISSDDLEEALKLQKTSATTKPLGTVLVEMGRVTSEVVEEELRAHIIDVVKDLLGWESGSFHFDTEEVVENSALMKAGLGAEFLLLEGARLKDEEARAQPQEPDIRPEGLGTESELSEDPESKKLIREGRKDLVLLTSMIEEVSGLKGSNDLILLILRFAGEIMNRAAVFLVRGKEIVGWGQTGVVLNNHSANEVIRKVSIPLAESSCLAEVVESARPFRGVISKNAWNEYLIGQLGGDWPEEAFIGPLLQGGRVTGVLYGDNLPKRSKIESTEGLEAFLKVSGFALQKLSEGTGAGPAS